MTNSNITSANINLVTFKKYDAGTQTYDWHHEVENMTVSAFMQCLDNLSNLMDVHWSMDFLNPDFTIATVYVKF